MRVSRPAYIPPAAPYDPYGGNPYDPYGGNPYDPWEAQGQESGDWVNQSSGSDVWPDPQQEQESQAVNPDDVYYPEEESPDEYQENDKGDVGFLPAILAGVAAFAPMAANIAGKFIATPGTQQQANIQRQQQQAAIQRQQIQADRDRTAAGKSAKEMSTKTIVWLVGGGVAALGIVYVLGKKGRK